MKLSDYVVKFFEGQTVKDIFMVSGGGCMHLVDSFGRSEKIKYWCTEHEQAAAMAAEAYAKMKNDIGLVLTTSGPGATNTLTGVLDCWQDSTPVIFISGQSKSTQTVLRSGITGLRQFGVQEGNIIPIVESITKYAVEVDNEEKIRYCLEKATHIAKSGRPGPVWLSIPLDIQSADVNPDSLGGYESTTEDRPIIEPTDEELTYCIEKLRAAQRPVIIGGHGIRLSGACEDFSAFVLRNNRPVVTPIMGIDILSGNHKCNIGRIGTKGTRAGNFAMQNADLIVSIGSRLSVSVVGHEYEKFARGADVIIVDIDELEHQKQTISNIGRIINCDAKAFINTISKRIDCRIGTDWLDSCNRWKEMYPIVLERYSNDENGINYYKAIDVINRHMKSQMPVISDAGSAFYVVSQTIDLKEHQRYITTGGTATMGFTLPASIGVAIANHNVAVIAITGEGSFMQNLQELEVIKYHNLNVKLFVMSNGGYFSIHKTQDRYFNGQYVGAGVESGVPITRIDKLADAFGIKYHRYEKIKDFDLDIDGILNSSEPEIIEIKVDETMEIIPTTSSTMRADGVLVSKPLEDMYPFLPRDEFYDEMIVKPISEG